jgi:hypothetical protein
MCLTVDGSAITISGCGGLAGLKWISGSDSHHDYDDQDDSALHEGCVRVEDALAHVLEHDRTAVTEAVQEDRARAWLKTGATWMEVLSTVSKSDKEQLRAAIRHRIVPPDDHYDQDDAGLFAVATDVAALLESAHSVYAELCTVEDDLKWAAHLRNATRACRDVILALSNAENQWRVQWQLADPVARLYAARRAGAPSAVSIERGDQNTISFVMKPDPASTPLHAYLAEWFSEYLTEHRQSVSLAVCVECGGFFERERKDNFYCSRTCQNRVAYKRKRIFEAGVLREIVIDPNQPSALQPGLCLHHPRFGLGIIDSVHVDRYIVTKPRPNWIGSPLVLKIREDQTMEQRVEEAKKSGLQGVDVEWEEVSKVGSLKVTARFLPTTREFARWELFGKSETVPAPTFFAIEDARKLADLL